MGKIRNGLVGLIVGTSLVAGIGMSDKVNAGDSLGAWSINKMIYDNMEKDFNEDGCENYWETIRRLNEQPVNQEPVQEQIEYNQSQQQNNQGALEVKEFFAFTREGWNDNGDEIVSRNEMTDAYKKELILMKILFLMLNLIEKMHILLLVLRLLILM